MMELQYHLLMNKSFLSERGLDLRNQIYGMWKREWERIYADQGSAHTPTADDFIRHDFFSALVVMNRVVGFSAHSLLDFRDESTYDRDYFQMFGRSYSSALQDRGLNRAMSFESLIVDVEFRRNPWELPLSRLLMRINSYLLGATSADAMMAVARNDNGVSGNLTRLGYTMVEEGKLCRGFPCDLQTLPRGEHLKPIDDKIEPLAGSLWRNRTVHADVPFMEFKATTEKKAA